VAQNQGPPFVALPKLSVHYREAAQVFVCFAFYTCTFDPLCLFQFNLDMESRRQKNLGLIS
jgi:hypothetical protein